MKWLTRIREPVINIPCKRRWGIGVPVHHIPIWVHSKFGWIKPCVPALLNLNKLSSKTNQYLSIRLWKHKTHWKAFTRQLPHFQAKKLKNGTSSKEIFRTRGDQAVAKAPRHVFEYWKSLSPFRQWQETHYPSLSSVQTATTEEEKKTHNAHQTLDYTLPKKGKLKAQLHELFYSITKTKTFISFLTLYL